MVALGQMRHRIVLADPSTSQTKGAMGGLSVSYTTSASTVWGSVRPFGGSQALRDGMVQADITHTIEIRYRASTTPETRVAYGSRKFDVLEVVNTDERGQWMTLRCRETL